jgi:hypothetical protein
MSLTNYNQIPVVFLAAIFVGPASQRAAGQTHQAGGSFVIIRLH